MEHTIKLLENRPSWKQAMRKTCRNNKLNVDIVSYYTPLRFRAAYSKFQAIYQKKSSDKSERWIENELKAFYWICVAIGCVYDLKIAQFTPKQWQLIQTIFHFKLPITLHYQGKKLVEEPNNKLTWTDEEDRTLIQILNNYDKASNKWNEYARKLFEISEKRFFRTGKQCRQRWLNHLDPSKKHSEWTKEEDIEVVKLFIDEGKKWSLIAKKLGNERTQHMVKNRYKTILSRQRRQYPKIRSQAVLIKSFLDPNVIEKTPKKQQNEQEIAVIKEQNKSLQIQALQSKENQQFVEESESQKPPPQEKNIPHTSCAFELPQVYSPWYVNIPITPTFSPSLSFFVNISSFSGFEANYTNQFYCPRGESQKHDQ